MVNYGEWLGSRVGSDLPPPTYSEILCTVLRNPRYGTPKSSVQYSEILCTVLRNSLYGTPKIICTGTVLSNTPHKSVDQLPSTKHRFLYNLAGIFSLLPGSVFLFHEDTSLLPNDNKGDEGLE